LKILDIAKGHVYFFSSQTFLLVLYSYSFQGTPSAEKKRREATNDQPNPTKPCQPISLTVSAQAFHLPCASFYLYGNDPTGATSCTC
jgi:hypothetical protein